MAANELQIIFKAIDELSATADKIKASLGGIAKSSTDTGEALSVALGQIGRDAFNQVTQAAARFSDQMMKGAVDATNISAQLEAVLKSSAGGGMGEDMAAQMSKVQGELNKASSSFAQKQADIAKAMAADLVAVAADAAAQLESLAASHADKLAGIQASLQDLTQSYNLSREERAASLNNRLVDMENSYKDRRESLQEQLAAAETKTQKRKIQEEIKDLDTQYRRETALAKQRAAQEETFAKQREAMAVARIQAQIAKENAEYDKQVIHIKALEEEKSKAVEATYAKEVEVARKAYDEIFGGLKTQIAAIQRPLSDAARMTEADIRGLADEYKKLTRYDEDAIIAGETTLLQFSHLGKDIFPRVTTAMLDMAERMKMDLPSAARILGRALDMPAEGMSVLTRYGVRFTDTQKALITEMVRVGDTAGAQAIILKGLESAFGGAAVAAGETYSGAMDRLTNAWGDFQKAMGLSLTQNKDIVEMLNSLANIINNDLIPAFNKLPEGAKVGVAGTVLAVGGLAKIGPSLIGIGLILKAFGGGKGIVAGVATAFAGLADKIYIVKYVLAGIGEIIAGSLTVPVLILIGAIAILILTWDTFGKQATETAGMIDNIIAGFFKRAWYEITNFGKQLVDWVRGIADSMGAWWQTVGTNIVNGIWTGIQAAWEGLKTNVSTALNDLLTWIQNAIGSGSPSKLYAEKVGLPMAQGIQQGFTSGLGLGQSSFSAALMPAPAMAYAGAPAGGGNNYSVRVYGELSTEAQRRMRRQAEDISYNAVKLTTRRR